MRRIILQWIESAVMLSPHALASELVKIAQIGFFGFRFIYRILYDPDPYHAILQNDDPNAVSCSLDKAKQRASNKSNENTCLHEIKLLPKKVKQHIGNVSLLSPFWALALLGDLLELVS